MAADGFSDYGDGGTPLSLIADLRGGGAETNGKASLDVAEAALQLARAGLSWSALGTAATINYAFRASANGMPSSVQGFTNFTTVQIQTTLLALQAWSDVAGLVFVRQDDGTGYSDNAAILFGNYSSGQEGAAAFAYLPGSTAAASVAGDVWVNSSLSYNAVPALWGYGQLTLVHEIGHALGLLHPAEYDAADGVSITYAAHATYAEDSNQYTVMSYFRETATGASYGSGRYAAAPLLDDIAAAQRLYGANMSTRTGDTTYGFNSTADRSWFSASASGPAPIFAIWDAGGTDTLDFSGYSGAQLLDLRQGAFSNLGALIGNVSIAIGAVIENAIGGAGDDVINGNSANNRITPGAGNNRVEGGLGSDTLVFASARSSYTITFNGQDGFISGPEGTTQFRNVEFLAFSDMTIAASPGAGGVNLSGDMTNDTIDGTSFGDTLYGAGGNDLIRGLDGTDQLTGGRGDDTLDGGAGNDLLYIDQGNDVIAGGGGVDTLNADLALSGMQIDLWAGTITGGGMGVDSVSGIERVVGTRFNDVIIGGVEDNYLQGFGGIDTLRGGDGNDELVASWAEGGGGADVTKSAQQVNNAIASAVSLDAAFDRLPREGVLSYAMPHATVVATTHGGLEYYAFTVGANTTVTLDIDGAAFDSTIRIFDGAGNELASNDDATYNGDGGRATDSFLNFLCAAAGTYYVQVGQWDEQVAGGGFTTVTPPAGLSYTLHVTVPGHLTQPTYAQGSELHGDAGDDILRSSVGSDILDGGSGDDVAVFTGTRSSYSISVSGGVTTVSNADGSDTVTNVEWLQFLDVMTDAAGLTVVDNDFHGTSGADVLTGDGGTNLVVGLYGDDVLSGQAGNDVLRGGFGADRLDGGSGNDILDGGRGSDHIDGGSGEDTLLLTGRPTDYFVSRTSNGYTVSRAGDRDTVQNVESVSFDGGASSITMTEFERQAFDPRAYLEANRDVYATVGLDLEAARAHYFNTGANTGRSAGSFDALLYIASNPDLLLTFGTDQNRALDHYIGTGAAEGRDIDSFDPYAYIAANPDLVATFGNDIERATEHYIVAGFSEGRPLSGFDARLYTASNADLAIQFGADDRSALLHYLDQGFAEGRPTTGFDPLLYAASSPDLAATFRTDSDAALHHYLVAGAVEGRPLSSFDPLMYAASHRDLAATFRTDAAAALNHYLVAGVHEGRSPTGFDPLIYAASYLDLAVAFRTDADAALNHYLVAGVHEGRSPTGFNPLIYAASHPDLAATFGTDAVAALNHYLVAGVHEGRSPTGFDPLIYAASHIDLARAFGADATAALNHYLTVGFQEGLSPTGFDPLLYAASNIDLALAFHADAAAAVNHYLVAGLNEGRSLTGFDPLLYAASYPDLAAAFGTDAAAALNHYLVAGVHEGRSPTGPNAQASSSQVSASAVPEDDGVGGQNEPDDFIGLLNGDTEYTGLHFDGDALVIAGDLDPGPAQSNSFELNETAAGHPWALPETSLESLFGSFQDDFLWQ